MNWPKLDSTQILKRVNDALGKNTNYRDKPVLGIPATYLDPEIFYPDAPFLAHAPFLNTLVANPNHIGCHTLKPAEKLFCGTQELEKELIGICAEEILGGEKEKQDGYVASGGTEGNIEALWIYRNYFRNTLGAAAHETAVVFSEDTHYSVSKGIDLLGLRPLKIPVDQNTRQMQMPVLEQVVTQSLENGTRYFILVLNMSTTMFGSVDDIEAVTLFFESRQLIYRVHIDAAFGGFIYPFSNPGNPYTFKNPHISSFSIDAHKLLQTPYGTGIFLARKNLMGHVCTREAQYVPGTDHTLCGSRSGANAISIWMVLHNYGAEGWKNKIGTLIGFTNEICSRLDEMQIPYYRNPFMNIITLQADAIDPLVAQKYFLVADSYEKKPQWWKIVVMPHLTRGIMDRFFQDLSISRNTLRHEPAH